MKFCINVRRLTAFVLGLAVFSSVAGFAVPAKPLASATRTVTDMAGRKVTIPAKVNHVISLSNNTSVAVYIIDPDKLLGWSFTPKTAAKPFIQPKYFNLPVIATNTEDSASLETIVKMKPDVIICSNEDEVYDPDKLQKQLGIPVVYVDTELKNTDKVLTFLGNVLGDSAKVNALAADSKARLSDVESRVAKVPKAKRLKVYYAEGTNWLNTDVSGNVHTQVIDLAGGVNVANVAEDKTGSMVTVSLEQVISWNPDVIIVGATAAKGDFYSKVYQTPEWAGISAVKNKRIYKAPSLPFNWVDRPPSAVRVLGVQWLANILYPNTVRMNIKSYVKSYYSKYLHVRLSDKQALNIMNSVS